MNEISLRIKLGNREYPMRVKAEEEDNVRAAAKIINEKVKQYRNQFSIEDKQDLLAMVAFDCTMSSMRESDGNEEEERDLLNKLQEINESVKRSLSES